MALFVGPNVSLKTTSIRVIEVDGSVVWEGKAESETCVALEDAHTLARRNYACRYRGLATIRMALRSNGRGRLSINLH